jgi:bifunctional non-homologous end joining protein LigD
VRLYSRNGGRLDCPEVVDVLRKLEERRVVIECEIIELAQQGKNGHAPGSKAGECAIRLYALDLLHLNGRDLTSEPIEYRKHRLCGLTLDTSLLFSPSLDCEPDMLVEEVARLGLPGIIAKRRGSAYHSGKNNGSWVTKRVKPSAVRRTRSSR